MKLVCVHMCACACTCVRACARACVRVCVRARACSHNQIKFLTQKIFFDQHFFSPKTPKKFFDQKMFFFNKKNIGPK